MRFMRLWYVITRDRWLKNVHFESIGERANIGRDFAFFITGRRIAVCVRSPI